MRYKRKYDLSALLNVKAVKISPPFTWFTIVATWFYVGLIGFMPGTFGSIASYPIYWGIINKAEDLKEVIKYFWFASIIISLIGWWAVTKYQKATNTFDHKSVVIDEVLGMMLAFSIGFDAAYSLAKQLQISSLQPWNTAFIIIFIVFRFYDIRKPFFIRTIDKKIKNAFGVMLDDAIAGLYTAITIIVFDKLYGFIVQYV